MTTDETRDTHVLRLQSGKPVCETPEEESFVVFNSADGRPCKACTEILLKGLPE